MSKQKLVNEIRGICQVDKFDIIKINDTEFMAFKVVDSDCEYAFEKFAIHQINLGGIPYNLIDLAKPYNNN